MSEKKFLITESQLKALLDIVRAASSVVVDEIIFESESTLDVFINDNQTSLCSLPEQD